ncbi:A disintegrin and metalloproteinase with thrombospondin motifs 6-like [Glandiceps talaboti]
MGACSLWNFFVAGLLSLSVVTANLHNSRYFSDQAHFMESLEHYHVASPVLVDEHGKLISYDLINSRKRTPRSTNGKIHPGVDRQLYYKLSAYEKDFHLDLQLHSTLVSGQFRVEYWDQNGLSWTHQTHDACHYVGHVKNELGSRAAISNCHGLHGVFATATDEYIIEPLYNLTENHRVTEGHPHLVYRRSAIVSKHPNDDEEEEIHPCGIDDSKDNSKKWWMEDTSYLLEKTKQQIYPHRRRKRSLSRENYVETLVAVDKMMYGYHGRDNIEPYILTIMNIVASLYHDASIGNSINVVVSRMVIVMKDQQDLEINHNADKSLESFCTWQQRNNPDPNSKQVLEEGLSHHDNAVLITRYDICAKLNEPCGTLGLAPVGGMCNPDRSCSINEDMGLATSFTIAHEMGHNFGMQHDGRGNSCGTPGHEQAKIMASQLTSNTDPFEWSSCSKKYVSGFLDAGWGTCLNNSPSVVDNLQPTEMPGQVHSADEQCKLQHGEQSSQCKYLEVCRELWCISKNNRCVTNSIPAAEGTKCLINGDNDRWCYQGECVPFGHRPLAIDGQWGEWTSWGVCSRTCGGGVSTSERHCDSPRPAHGGKFCIGERKKYKSCNTDDCEPNSRDFRELQCSKYDNELFNNKYHTWKPFTGSQVKKCALHCLAVNYHFYTEKSPQVIDGTRCSKDSLDICINGQCRHVGCDKMLNSEAKEDRCRVCGGDGSTCEIVAGIVTEDLPGGSYQEVITIPRGSVHINISEISISKNYLALKSVNDDYYVNGQWTIDWPSSYDVAGTTFKYERPPDEPEVLTASGPTNQDLIVMLLLQETNKGVTYQYNVPVTRTGSGDDEVTFSWEHVPWSECSATCAGGESTAPVICVRSDDRTEVVDSFCDKNTKPVDRRRPCNTEPCPSEWFQGEWSLCSQTCGGGFKVRSVACISKIGPKEQETVPEDQCKTRKPLSRETCGTQECPPVWFAKPWGECTPSCGAGHTTRSVTCTSSDMKQVLHPKHCPAATKPLSKRPCNNGECPPPTWVVGEWGSCSAECGKGQQSRSVDCRAYTGLPAFDCSESLKPPQIQQCETPCVPVTDNEECEDANQVTYCPLVLRFKFCNRDYFKQMCCKSCSLVGN